MGFPYVQSVSIHRLKTVAGSTDAAIGNVGYSGAEQPSSSDAGEVAIATGIACSIQAGAAGRRKDGTLPGDIVTMPTWNIYLAPDAVARNVIRDRDIVVDDEGYRYEIGQADWDVLGYKLVCIRLQS